MKSMNKSVEGEGVINNGHFLESFCACGEPVYDESEILLYTHSGIPFGREVASKTGGMQSKQISHKSDTSKHKDIRCFRWRF